MTVRFLLVCEGSSDAALIPHIGRLLIQFGEDDPLGSSWTGSKPLTDKIREGLQHSTECDLLLVHRDADASQETGSAGPERRYAEIEEAVLVPFPDGLVDTGKSPPTPDSRASGNDGQVKRVFGIRHIQMETVLGSGFNGPWVAIVPVRMTESWLLLDDSAIRQRAGRPNGNAPLGLPRLC